MLHNFVIIISISFPCRNPLACRYSDVFDDKCTHATIGSRKRAEFLLLSRNVNFHKHCVLEVKKYQQYQINLFV